MTDWQKLREHLSIAQSQGVIGQQPEWNGWWLAGCIVVGGLIGAMLALGLP